ncbi:MAG: methyltransferase domain-containing protein [Bacteroidota bacterium]
MGNTDKHYWENRWQQQQTGWDLGMVSPPLKQYIDSLTDKGLRILIPGCGNAYEAHYLIDRGFTNVTVIDIAPSLIDVLTQSFEKAIATGYFKAICGDFFAHRGEYDLILEQTFFCAINPSLRQKYADHCYRLLAPGGKVAGILFNCEFEGGPPFGGDRTEYETYFNPVFHSVKMEPCLTSAAPRAGRELFIELVKS